jgi:hypothetical protein
VPRSGKSATSVIIPIVIIPIVLVLQMSAGTMTARRWWMLVGTLL